AEKMVEYYSMADAMLSLSVQETFGKMTAESIASGTPVIGYNSTATPELIGNGCGKVVELNATIDEIAQAVEEIRENGKDKYFNTCVEFARNNFDKNKLISDYIDLYKEMIEKK
ncbi:MAG: glycosyltransferase, partial [Clostridia bacterium]|nr:glycosyltransferase [Clostridia bacterium]